MHDRDVSDALDHELRALLSACFTDPDEDQVFSYRRYWKEPPAYRWIMRNSGGDLIAHPGLEGMGFEFATLFGDPHVYRSSGYRIANDLVRYFDDKEGGWRTMRFDGGEDGAFLWFPLTRRDWPEGVVDIRGPKF